MLDRKMSGLRNVEKLTHAGDRSHDLFTLPDFFDSISALFLSGKFVVRVSKSFLDVDMEFEKVF